jgi:hypothetical protein
MLRHQADDIKYLPLRAAVLGEKRKLTFKWFQIAKVLCL